MKHFAPRDKVVLTEAVSGYETFVGKVGEVLATSEHEFLPGGGVALVDWETEAGKISYDHLEMYQPEEEPSHEIPEGARVITREDFDAAMDVLNDPVRILSSDHRASDFVSFVCNMATRNRLEDVLFKTADEVVMSELGFCTALWDACNPTIIHLEGDPLRAPRESLQVAIASVIGIRELAKILFDEPEND